jgi:hypothetical protein
MFDFAKEVTLSHAMGEFFAALEDRLNGKDGYGITEWYGDVAWGVRLFIENEVPLFVGKNEETWVTLADALDERAAFHSGNAGLAVKWVNPDEDDTWAEAAVNMKDAVGMAQALVKAIRTEDADWSGPLPSGEKGVNLGEAFKIVRLFTDKFWAADLKWSRTPSPNKKWVWFAHKELMAVYATLGEPSHGGDLGQPGSGTPGNIPWSYAGQ